MTAPEEHPADLGELRRDLRHWRRGRADTTWGEVVSEAYIALFSGLVLTSMVVSVLVNLRLVSDEACSAAGCRDARTVLPWLVVVGALALAVAVARLLGPVFVSPAVASWLLATPVDRRALLRRRLLVTTAGCTVGVAVVAAAAATLGGLRVPLLVALVGSSAALAVAGVAAAALAQERGPRAGRWLTRAPALLAWLGLLGLALGVPVAGRGHGRVPAVVLGPAVAACVLLAVALGRAAVVRLPRLARHHLVPGGRLAPGLSGALATLDLALAYDVVHGHRWNAHLPVHSRRGGPSGPARLVWADLVRVRRSPGTVLLPLASVVVAYAARSAGAGRPTLLLAGLAAFATALPLLAGLRVLTRTPGLLRVLPFPDATARRASLVVPAVVLLVVGLAAAPALAGPAEGPEPATAVALALAVAAAALAAAVRWVSGRPPDYSRPLVSTPAGAVPTNLYGSVLRGLDVLLVALVPVLVAPTLLGAVVSVLVAVGVLAHLTARA